MFSIATPAYGDDVELKQAMESEPLMLMWYKYPAIVIGMSSGLTMPSFSRGANRRRLSSLRADLKRIEDSLYYYRHLSALRSFVENQSLDSVTLTRAAEAIGISPSQLSRLFTEKTGTSFRSWLALRRVVVAMELMCERQVLACEAARLSGFASYRSFARTFKQTVGINPSTYGRLVDEELRIDHQK